MAKQKAGIGSARFGSATREIRQEYRRVRGNAWKRAQRAGVTREQFRAEFPTIKDLEKSGRASQSILRARVEQEKAGTPERRAASTANLRNVGEARPAQVTAWERGAYSIESLKSGIHSEAELRAEYSRLRGVLRARAGRIEASEEFTGRTIPYNMRLDRYKSLTEIPRGPEGQRALIYGLRELAAAVESPMSSLTGLRGVREKSLETFREHGYTFVNKENYEQFGRFMELARVMGMNRLYDSKRVAEQYRGYKEQKLTETEMLDRFQTWINEQPAARQVNQIPVSSNRVRRSLA